MALVVWPASKTVEYTSAANPGSANASSQNLGDNEYWDDDGTTSSLLLDVLPQSNDTAPFALHASTNVGMWTTCVKPANGL